MAIDFRMLHIAFISQHLIPNALKSVVNAYTFCWFSGQRINIFVGFASLTADLSDQINSGSYGTRITHTPNYELNM